MHDICFLVVDDSPTIKALVKKVLENKLGARDILMASDGKEALQILKTKKVDFILSDWEMPNMGGDELLYEVRQSKDLAHIPFIMMTAHGGKDFIMTALQSGVTHYLVKPFTAMEMEDRIRKSWNGAAKRNADRFSMLPAHNLLVKNSAKSMPGKLMDISCTGCLIRMEYNDELRLFGQYQLSVEFEGVKQNETFAVSPIHGSIMRLESDSGEMGRAGKLCQVAVYFPAKMMEKKTEDKLNELVKWLASLSPENIIEK